jgi:hypothetical protein
MRGCMRKGRSISPVRSERSRGAYVMSQCQRPSTKFIQSDAAGGVEGLGTNEVGVAFKGGFA